MTEYELYDIYIQKPKRIIVSTYCREMFAITVLPYIKSRDSYIHKNNLCYQMYVDKSSINGEAGYSIGYNVDIETDPWISYDDIDRIKIISRYK